MMIDIDDVLNTLKVEQEVLRERLSSLVGQQTLLQKLVQHYAELKVAKKNEN